MRHSRIFIMLALIVLAGVTSVLAQDAAPGKLPNLDGRTVTVAVENAYPPFNSVDEAGNGIGWDYDTINEICARLNCVPEYIVTPWEGMILAVSNGEYDVAADGITITEERKTQVDFSDGYMSAEQVLLTRVGEDRFTNFDEFNADSALLVGTQPGTTNFDLAVELLGGEERIVGYETFGLAVQALIDGQVDAVFMDNTAGQGYVGVNGDLVQITGEPLTSDELGFIFPLGSDLVEPFNLALDQMDFDGTLDIITGRWFPPALPNLNGRVVKVAVENAYPPFNFLDDAGNAMGWDYDTIDEICVRLNCVPEYVVTPWEGMILAVSNGEFDVAADGISITRDRAVQVDFSVGYIKTNQVLLVRIDEDRFTNIDDFVANPDLLLGTQPGTTNYELGKTVLGGEDRLRGYETFGLTVQALLAGDIDAVIMDDTAGFGYVGANADAVKITGFPMQSDALGFIYPKGSDLVSAFDAAIISMFNDGKLAEITAKWFSPAGSE